ncbi:MAG TPA: MBL fold metallo-hydrolase [Magnetospirillum sp.]|nr:MBL fold metallo-hydrolase [Magnetospirillum sp.]
MAKIEVLTAGHCCNFSRMARRRDPWRWTRFPAAFALIRPVGGAPMLFDTGYSRHVPPAMARFPFGLYRRLLPVTTGPDAVEQLRQRGIAPEQVGTIVISHFHPDHIGGLRDFPAARFVCSRAAWQAVRGRNGFAALRRGFLADLVPPDFAQRVTFAEDLPAAPMMADVRLLTVGDEQFLLPALDGHVPGQLGLVAEAGPGTRMLFAADAVWRRSCLADGVGPHALAMRIHHDRRAYAATVARLAGMLRDDPGLIVVPSHDPPPC